MTAAQAVQSAGAYASIQDMGRRGLRRIGVPWAGVLDRQRMRIAKRLVGNAEDAPVIECLDGGQRFSAVDGAVRIAVAGDARLSRERDGARLPLAACRMAKHPAYPG